ncbi:MAG: FkbM family methyltransferase, partial [Pyrinomonadaceae bacterium]
MKQQIHHLLRRSGYDVIRYSPTSHPLARRRKLLDTFGINLVLDVGANIGQYAKELRAEGYKGRIVSFEPLSSAYMELEAAARADGLWETLNVGLGDAEQDATINIAGNSFSSSLYQMLPSHIGSAPESKYIGQERIYIKTLDSIFGSHYSKDQNVLLKIDVQGFEEKVIAGAKNSLPFINTIQLEMSLMPLYDGELL